MLLRAEQMGTSLSAAFRAWKRRVERLVGIPCRFLKERVSTRCVYTGARVVTISRECFLESRSGTHTHTCALECVGILDTVSRIGDIYWKRTVVASRRRRRRRRRDNASLVSDAGALDGDGDGHVSVRELLKGLRKLGAFQALDVDAVDALVRAELDADGSGLEILWS